MRGECKNAISQSYLFEGYANFIQKAVELDDVDVIVFLSFEPLDSEITRHKKEREIIKDIKSAHPEKIFIVVDGIKSSTSTLNLGFLSTPTKLVTYEDVVEGMWRTKSLYIENVKSGNSYTFCKSYL